MALQGGKRPLRRAPPYPPTSSQKMLEGVEIKATEMFDRDFRARIGKISPDNIDEHITVYGRYLMVFALRINFSDKLLHICTKINSLLLTLINAYEWNFNNNKKAVLSQR